MLNLNEKINADIKTPESITEIIDNLCVTLSKVKVHFEGYNRISLNKFYALPSAAQEAIKDVLKYTQISAGTVIDINRNNFEVQMVKKVCEDVNLVVPEDFLSRIRVGDIVEVYEHETAIQIYRNFEFLKHCSYDLLTVCTTPLDELFTREDGYQEKIANRATEITLNAGGTQRWAQDGSLDHILMERIHSNNKVFQLKLGFIAPITHKITGKRMAWASTLRAECLGPAYKHLANVVPL